MDDFYCPGSYFVFCNSHKSGFFQLSRMPPPLPQLLQVPLEELPITYFWSRNIFSVASQSLLTPRPPVPTSTLEPRKSRYSPHNSPVGPTSPSLPIADHTASLLVSGPALRLTLPGRRHTCCLPCLCCVLFALPACCCCPAHPSNFSCVSG